MLKIFRNPIALLILFLLVTQSPLSYAQEASDGEKVVKKEKKKSTEKKKKKGKGFFAAAEKEVKIQYDPAKVVDPKFGIKMYEKLNMRTGKDSTRKCRGYACEGWVVDKYNTGKTLHKGFYVKGRLQFYKNYYPNGELERDFKVQDDRRSTVKLYYDSGQLKSHVKYSDGNVSFWEDYYPNGNLDYHEAYNKKLEYYISQKSYREDGTPEYEMELTDKKNMRYSRVEFHSNGQQKGKGQVRFNRAKYDYEKTGVWIHYGENGQPKEKVEFVNGKIVTTTPL